jgi:hypothetical protein
MCYKANKIYINSIYGKFGNNYDSNDIKRKYYIYNILYKIEEENRLKEIEEKIDFCKTISESTTIQISVNFLKNRLFGKQTDRKIKILNILEKINTK